MRLSFVRCNYWSKYTQRCIARATGYDLWQPLVGWKLSKRKPHWIYTENPPWTEEAVEANQGNKKLREFIEPIPKGQWMIYKGDRVQILKGVDTGKIGIVCLVVKERNWCFVEGLNCVYKWAGKTADNPGDMLREERPLLVTSEVALLDPSDQQPTQVEWRYDSLGNRVRVSTRSGRIIPINETTLDTGEDGVNTRSYEAQDCDTTEKDLMKDTFTPSLLKFEDDIMKKMGIKETRKKAPTYFY